MPATGSRDPLEAALDELYGVEPTEFVGTRKRLAASLRAAGETGAAKALGDARRPTTAAWALNELSRREPAVVEEFLDRSDDLQAAQLGALAGGREAMRDATRAQRQALAAAADAALALLGTRATDAYRSQILGTLQAASADEEIGEQLRKGRVVREVTGATGFPDTPGLTLVPDLAPEAEPAPSPKPPKRAPNATWDRPPSDDSTLLEQRRRDREREAAEQAEQRRAEADATSQRAQQEVAEAEAAATAARTRVNELRQDLDAARREARTAEDRAASARREATRLARAAAKLPPPPKPDS